MTHSSRDNKPVAVEQESVPYRSPREVFEEQATADDLFLADCLHDRLCALGHHDIAKRRALLLDLVMHVINPVRLRLAGQDFESDAKHCSDDHAEADRLLKLAGEEMQRIEPDPKWWITGNTAKRAIVKLIREHRAALSHAAVGEGYAVVPSEPTEAMIEAGRLAWWHGVVGSTPEHAMRDCWSAMLSTIQPPSPDSSEDVQLLKDGNAWYSQSQVDEMERDSHGSLACKCGTFPRPSGNYVRPDDGWRSMWCQGCLEHVVGWCSTEAEAVAEWNRLRTIELTTPPAAPRPIQAGEGK